MKRITAKFNSKCAETGKAIKKGDRMYYDYATKKCYADGSPTALKEDARAEDQSVSNYIDAQERAAFERY